MLSNLAIGVVAGFGAAGWIYFKLQRYTGNNTQSSLTGAGAAGLLVCLIVTTLLGILF